MRTSEHAQVRLAAESGVGQRCVTALLSSVHRAIAVAVSVQYESTLNVRRASCRSMCVGERSVVIEQRCGVADGWMDAALLRCAAPTPLFFTSAAVRSLVCHSQWSPLGPPLATFTHPTPPHLSPSYGAVLCSCPSPFRPLPPPLIQPLFPPSQRPSDGQTDDTSNTHHTTITNRTSINKIQ